MVSSVLSRRTFLQAASAGVSSLIVPACRKRKAKPAAAKAGPGRQRFEPGGKWADVPAESVQVRRVQVKVEVYGYKLVENVYVVNDTHSRDAIIIDPGGPHEQIDASIKASGLRVRAILNTHGHLDHTGANARYAKKFGVPVWGHPGDTAFYNSVPEGGRPARWWKQDGILHIGGLVIAVYVTPGHTEGSTCFRAGNALFTGDTLFRGGIGKTFGSAGKRQADTNRVINNIKTKLLPLGDGVRVLPGHGEGSTVGHERRTNGFLSNRRFA